MVAITAFLMIVHPKVVKYNVANATLIEFDYTNNALHYNLALKITISNPNKFVGIYYDCVEALALYQDVEFDSQILGTFFQPDQNTSVLSPVFKGKKPLSSNQISKLNIKKSSSIYHIDVELYMKVRYKVGLIKIPKKLKVHYDLLVPLKSHNTTKLANGFQATNVIRIT
ncbi:YLS9 protein [Spatholobus suberectus]|nr:YLS9 protein [Spatholobus suberectus]